MTKLERLRKEYRDADLELMEAVDTGCDDVTMRQYSRWLDEAITAYYEELNAQPVTAVRDYTVA